MMKPLVPVARRRWILGGAWSDRPYSFTNRLSLPPFDRSSINGFRTVKYLNDGEVAESLLAERSFDPTDHRSWEPVSDELFEVLAGQFAYDRGPLNETIEWADDSGRDAVHQKITFDAGYDGERTPLHLFLPKRSTPPYKTVVFFPTAYPFMRDGNSDTDLFAFPGPEQFVVKSGMALAFPVWDGSYERRRPIGGPGGLQGAERERAHRTRMAHHRQDLGRTLDYLETRADIDVESFAYLGFSAGGSFAVPLLALEDRFRAAIFVTGGSMAWGGVRDLHPLHYAPRVTLPVLFLAGRYDYVFPVQTSQHPLFDLLGTPEPHKRHVTLDGGHWPLPQSQWIPEALEWLEQYLGPVDR